MSAMSPLPKDHPIMIAWEKYKSSDAYANSFRWAEHEQHREGSMWAAFLAGYDAYYSTPTPTADRPEGVAETLLDALERMTALYESEFDVGEYRRPEWLKTALSKRYTQPSKPTPASGEQMEAPQPAQPDLEVVGWMHPISKWANHDKSVIQHHCRKDGTDGGPQPLVRLTDAQARIAALTAKVEKWEKRFWKMDENFDRAVARAETAEARVAQYRGLIDVALEALDNYADPSGYFDSVGEDSYTDGDQYHPGVLAKDTATSIRSALHPEREGK